MENADYKTPGLDRLKIDKSFVDDIPDQRNDMKITFTIVAMAKILRMKVAGRSRKNHAQLSFLKAQGCNFYQGYLTSRPLPVDDFEHFWRQHLNQTLHRSSPAAPSPLYRIAVAAINNKPGF